MEVYMELFIDTQKKAALQKAIAKSKKSVRIINIIATVLLLAGLIGGACYALANVVVPSMSIVHVNGVPQKDISWIIISTSLIVGPCVLTSVFLRVLCRNIAGVNNASRVDECLVVSEEGITYSFRHKHQTLPADRIVISIRYADIQSVTFEENTGFLKFDGTIKSEYLENGKLSNSSTLNTFTICDYFAPSLKEVLTLKGVDL